MKRFLLTAIVVTAFSGVSFAQDHCPTGYQKTSSDQQDKVAKKDDSSSDDLYNARNPEAKK